MTASSSSHAVASLNAQQRDAVLTRAKAVLVLAGPGTGKTRTLTVRLATLLTRRHVAPESLLAVTFTERAARHMRERLHSLVGDVAHRVVLGTFHGLCLRLLREEGHRLDLPRDFGIVNGRDQVTIMQKVLKQVGRPDNRSVAQRTLHDLSAIRSHGTPAPASLERAGLSDVYERYHRHLRKSGLLDFDDLLCFGVEVLESRPEVRSRLRRHVADVSVDEYQDVNPVQHRLIDLLVGDEGNLWVVGDGDQAIYAFRGAVSEHLLAFCQRYVNGKVFRLERSYRLTPPIAAAASQVIGKNPARPAYTLNADRISGAAVQVVSVPDERAEAEWVVRQIEERVGGTSHYQHARGHVTDTVSRRERCFRDVAVLCRLHVLTIPLQEALARSGVPFRVVGETRWFDKNVVKDVVAYLKVIHNPHDPGLARVLNRPPRGIGVQTQTALEAEAERRGCSLYETLGRSKTLSASQVSTVRVFLQRLEEWRDHLEATPLSRLLAHVADVTDLQRWHVEQDPRQENDVRRLHVLAAKYDEMHPPDALRQFLEEVDLAVEADDYDADADAVSVMTLHAAKGLEFPEVMMCGVEEGILPYEHGDLEEERRLFYVGLTRTSERAHLLHCRSRFLFGDRRDRTASRFLAEFDDALKSPVVMADRPRRSKQERGPEQLSFLS